MGRAPCCDKANVKKGPWSPEEDAKLKSYIEQYGTGGNWIALPQKIGLKRCGKSCRLRWLNYLRPNIKHGGFSEEEDNIICSLYISIGSRWSIIAAQLPGRTDNDIKNYWNTRLKKKLLGSYKQRRNNQHNVHRGIGTSTAQLVKPEITKRETELNPIQTMVTNNNNQNPYWPERPVLALTPYSTDQQQHCNDQQSIRKLLITFGGRFSNECNSNSTPSILIDHNDQQFYNELISPPDFGSLVQYNSPQILPGQGSVSTRTDSLAEIEEGEFHNHDPGQVVDGLGFVYGSENGIISGGTCNVHEHHGISWGEMSSLVYNNNNNIYVPTIDVSEHYPGVEREILLSALPGCNEQ